MARVSGWIDEGWRARSPRAGGGVHGVRPCGPGTGGNSARYPRTFVDTRAESHRLRQKRASHSPRPLEACCRPRWRFTL
jgi:hypothetical protein